MAVPEAADARRVWVVNLVRTCVMLAMITLFILTLMMMAKAIKLSLSKSLKQVNLLMH